MSETTTAPEAPAPITEAEFDKYFDTRGREGPTDAETQPPADAPAAVEAKAPEAKPAAAPAQPAKPDHVPLATYLEEREQRKAQAAQVADLQRQIEALTPKAAVQAIKIPTIEEDPVGHFTARLAQIEARHEAELGAIRQQTQQQTQQQQIAEAHRELIGGLAADEQVFVQEKPDYYEAMKHMKAARVAQLEAAGYNQQQIAQTWMQDVTALTLQARLQNKRPAETAYKMAATFGYVPKDAKSSQSEQTVEELLDPGAEKVATAKRGQEFATSVQSAGGSNGRRAATASDLLRMTPDQFARYEAQHPAEVRKAMGG